jgi:hypothetical protein
VHSYLIVVQKPGGVLPRKLGDLLDATDVADLWFEPESHLSWSSEGGDVRFAGWQSTSLSTGVTSYWEASEAGLTAFSGRPFPAHGPWETRDAWAAQLSRHFEELPLAQSREAYRGIFTLISLDRQGAGTLLADPLGLGLLFFSETDGFAAFSNRAALCARAITAEGLPRRDPVAAGWLAYHGYVLGNATGFQGVSVLPEGCWIELDPSVGYVRHDSESAPWRFPSPGPASDPNQLIAAVRDDIANTLRGAVAVPGPHLADITGGKDSRVILSLLISEGLASEVEFQTVGDQASADVRLALQAVNRLGLKHRTHPPLPLEGANFEQQIRIHAFQTSGTLGASDLIGRSFPMEHLHISGACGEILRTNYPAYRDIRDSQHMLRAFMAGMHFDTLGLIKPERRLEYDRWAADALIALPWEVDEPLDLIDIFYLRQRLRRWLGAEQELNFANRVFPLYSLVGVRAAFAVGAERRRAEFIPLQLLRRYGSELLELPLASGGWGRALAQEPNPDSARRQQRDAERRKWQAKALRENQEVFRKLLPSDADHPAFELLDRAAIASAIEQAESLTLHGRIQLYGAMTAIVWLGGGDLPWRVRMNPG